MRSKELEKNKAGTVSSSKTGVLLTRKRKNNEDTLSVP
jgi:hypothetical protein